MNKKFFDCQTNNFRQLLIIYYVPTRTPTFLLIVEISKLYQIDQHDQWPPFSNKVHVNTRAVILFNKVALVLAVTASHAQIQSDSSCFSYLSRDMRFPTMWYARPAKPQTSLLIRAV